MGVAALARSVPPALNAVGCSKLALRRGAPSLSRHARVAPDAVALAVEISPPDVVKRRTVRWHCIAAEVLQLSRCAKVEIRFCAPSIFGPSLSRTTGVM
jgi:hypothetical protein